MTVTSWLKPFCSSWYFVRLFLTRISCLIMRAACILAAAVVCAADVQLATFDGQEGTTFDFWEDEDPVMGSESYGNWTLDSESSFGILEATVRVVPRPAAGIPNASPGFVKVGASGNFSDASSTAGGALVLVARSNAPKYAGFRMAVASGANYPMYSCRGGGSIPLSSGCYKSPSFSIPDGDFTQIRIPFDQFSDRWSPPSGEIYKTCAHDARHCLTGEQLSSIQRIELVAEGEDGDLHIEIQSIFAEAASAGSSTLV